MTQARIIQKAKNAMQSGRYGTGQWILEFEPTDAQRADPLMGWAGSRDTRRQLRLSFKTLDAATGWNRAASTKTRSIVSNRRSRKGLACLPPSPAGLWATT